MCVGVCLCLCLCLCLSVSVFSDDGGLQGTREVGGEGEEGRGERRR